MNLDYKKLAEQYRDERDIALSQLADLGIAFGEKPQLKAITIEWLNTIAHRDICLIYRAVLLFIIEKWREENDCL